MTDTVLKYEDAVVIVDKTYKVIENSGHARFFAFDMVFGWMHHCKTVNEGINANNISEHIGFLLDFNNTTLKRYPADEELKKQLEGAGFYRLVTAGSFEMPSEGLMTAAELVMDSQKDDYSLLRSFKEEEIFIMRSALNKNPPHIYSQLIHNA